MALMRPELDSLDEELQHETTLLPQASLASWGFSGVVRAESMGEAVARTARERMAKKDFIVKDGWVVLGKRVSGLEN